MAPKPALTYKRDFDPNTGEKQRVEVTNTVYTAYQEVWEKYEEAKEK